jgi:hypothetical protein
LAAWREVETKLEALRSSTTQVWDLVLGGTDGSSLLATSMSTVAELLESCIDAAAANGVRWGSRTALVAIVSHFPELDVEHSVRMTKNEVDAL